MKKQVGISACLAGENVRYNQRDVLAADLIRDLQQHFELIPVCPEVAIGLAVPRDPIHLDAEGRVMDTAWKHDHSGELASVAEAFLQKYPKLVAFVFKSGSPSCGVGSVKIKNDQLETLFENGSGAFAKKLIEKNKILFAEDSSLVRKEDRQEFINHVLLK